MAVLAIILLLCEVLAASGKAGLGVDYPINLFIGTGGVGFGIGTTPPGVQLPFSMMRLSPDTAFDNIALGWRHCGGYYYGDNEIRCFSHTHLFGAGVVDYGHIGVMATRLIGSSVVTDYGYRSKFTHDDEIAYPGYYAVSLETHNVLAELTAAGPYTGLHQYTFFGQGSKFVLFDLSHSVQKGAIVNASVTFTGENSSLSLSGWSLLKGSLTGRNGVGVKVYFTAEFLQTPIGYGTWEGGNVHTGQRSASGNECGAFVDFSNEEVPVTVAVAISFISIEQARANLAHDWNRESFGECLENTENIWASTLSQVKVESEDHDALVKFHTSLYHSFCVPTQFNEAGGYYLGMDNAVHQVKKGTNYYSDLSLWDTHRTHAPLLTLLRPNVSEGIVNSLLAMYQQGGALPRWPIANVFSECMIANHGYQVILDSYVKGVRNFNVTVAYQAMVDEATNPNLPHTARPCLKEYISLGYCPMESDAVSVSLTLAYAFDDWAVGSLATLLNKTTDAKLFLNRSNNYRNVWSSAKQFMCPRSNSGDFHCPLDPEFNEWILKDVGYTEGDAAQWRWFVPHDIPGLVALFQSEETFTEQLQEFFDKAKDHTSNFLPNPYYWAGNEPDLLAVYLFNYVERPDLTQQSVRWLLEKKYTTGPEGLPGNDDYGTMSAWYIWGSLGLYPLTGTTTYFIGSPAVNKATLNLPSGKPLVITAVNLTADNVYVSKASLNEQEIDMKKHPFLLHSDLVNGGNLTFWMSVQPTNT